MEDGCGGGQAADMVRDGEDILDSIKSGEGRHGGRWDRGRHRTR